MSSYTQYHTQPTAENIAEAQAEFWPVLSAALAAAFAMLLPYIRGGLPSAVLAQITAKLKPAEALARRFFLLQARVAVETDAAAQPEQTAPPQERAAPASEGPAPRTPTKRDPYAFKLAEPWPSLLPVYGDTFESDWADSAFNNPYASQRTLMAIFTRLKALDAALKDPAKQIQRMARWLRKRAALEIGRKSPLAIGKPSAGCAVKRTSPSCAASPCCTSSNASAPTRPDDAQKHEVM